MSLEEIPDLITSIAGPILVAIGIGVAVWLLILAITALAKGNMKKAIVSFGTAIFAAVLGIVGITMIVNGAGAGKEIIETTTKTDGSTPLFEKNKSISGIVGE